MTEYEKHADQSAAVQTRRLSYGQTYYDKFATKISEVPTVSDWAREAWDCEKKNGICDGTRPKDTMTREEAVTMIYRLNNLK